MGQTGANGIDTGDTRTHTVPDYEKYSNRVVRSSLGLTNATHAHGQRYTHLNLNSSDKKQPDFRGESISLRNVVTTVDVEQQIEVKAGAQTEQKGGLYFEHGYNAHTPTDIVAASGYENVDMDNIAETLVNNPEFELKMTGHADTSGDVDKNQTLSENRLKTAEVLLVGALQRQGLSKTEAQSLYEERVAPHSTIIALGETEGPVNTEDGTIHQGNRVVSFDLLSQTAPEKLINSTISKAKDVDNHEHVVIVHLGTRDKRDNLDFYPEKHAKNLRSNQFSIADEKTHFVLQIDENRNLSRDFTINYKAENNLTADNTNFVIQTDEPGVVSSTYNMETNKIEVNLSGQVAVYIALPPNIDPAIINVGQINSKGEVTIPPLTNLDDVAPISEARRVEGERNQITNAADDIVQISIDAKHLYIKHSKDPAGYQAALEEYGFLDKIDEAFLPLKIVGIETGPYETLLASQYMNAESALYNPDQVVFPFQTYQGLYESEISVGHIEPEKGVDAYDALVGKVNTSLATLDDDNASADDHDNLMPDLPTPAAPPSIIRNN